MSDDEAWESCPWLHEEALKTDFFRMMQFKIRPCPLSSEPHDWKLCPLAHQSEKAKRRCPATVRHSVATCPVFRKGGACSRSSSCNFAHGVFESWLHPSRYRTKMCTSGAECKRPLCFFAHSEAELRESTPFQDIAALKARLQEQHGEAVEAALMRLGLAAQAEPWAQEPGRQSSLPILPTSRMPAANSAAISQGSPATGWYMQSPAQMSHRASLPHDFRHFSDDLLRALSLPQAGALPGSSETSGAFMHTSSGSRLNVPSGTNIHHRNGFLYAQGPSQSLPSSRDAALRAWPAHNARMQGYSIGQGIGMEGLPPLDHSQPMSRSGELSQAQLSSASSYPRRAEAASLAAEGRGGEVTWMQALSAAQPLPLPQTSDYDVATFREQGGTVPSSQANNYGVAAVHEQGSATLAGNALPNFASYLQDLRLDNSARGPFAGILAAGPAPQDHVMARQHSKSAAGNPASAGGLPPLSQLMAFDRRNSGPQASCSQASPAQSPAQKRGSSGLYSADARTQIWAATGLDRLARMGSSMLPQNYPAHTGSAVAAYHLQL